MTEKKSGMLGVVFSRTSRRTIAGCIPKRGGSRNFASAAGSEESSHSSSKEIGNPISMFFIFLCGK